VTQKVEFLFRQFADPRLGFIHRQLQLGHDVSHHGQRFFRSATAADHQVIGVVNDVCSKTLLVSEFLPSQHESTSGWCVPKAQSRSRGAPRRKVDIVCSPKRRSLRQAPRRQRFDLMHFLQTYRQLKEQRDKTSLQKLTSSDAAAPSVHSGSHG
jgi:hypothetical protein